MALFTDEERGLAVLLTGLGFTNPFLPERIAVERQVLGHAFVTAASDWNVLADSGAEHSNIHGAHQRAEALVKQITPRLREVGRATPRDLELYDALVLVLLYYRYRHRMHDLVFYAAQHPDERPRALFYDEYERDAQQLLDIPGVELPMKDELPHLFSGFFQIRRAFFAIFENLIGVSQSIIRLRAAVWQSLFSHDMQRYRRVLYKRNSDITTLITGESGTGKELVASAIALSGYIPFDVRTRTFTENHRTLFHPLNITALSPTLVESELFGHRRGSFTGAVADRTGWLEKCTKSGTVFLDEIGDLDNRIQVKLLRVLQMRVFQPIGDTESRNFDGKIIAATNRDLETEMAEARFRCDLYYRLCSDMITTPTLREQIHDSPEQLHVLVLHIARRIVGDEEAETLAREVEQWIEQRLGAKYEWPGNVRELEQCVRNVMMHREYRPIGASRRGVRDELGRAVAEGTITMDELMRQYCTLVYSQTGSYEETARRLGIDRRTVRSRIDRQWLERLGQGR